MEELSTSIMHFSNVLQFFGTKVSVLMGAAIGAVFSLIITKGLRPLAAIISLFVGFVTSVYVTPMIVDYFAIGTPSLENGIAFLLGVVGMNLLRGLSVISENFSKNPLSVIMKFFKRGE